MKHNTPARRRSHEQRRAGAFFWGDGILWCKDKTVEVEVLKASPLGRGQARSEAQRQERVACASDESVDCWMSPVRAGTCNFSCSHPRGVTAYEFNERTGDPFRRLTPPPSPEGKALGRVRVAVMLFFPTFFCALQILQMFSRPSSGPQSRWLRAFFLCP